MSEKRYFYRDPLAAAWMAKHFGMEFANGDNFQSAIEVAGDDMKEMPFVVHPDSLYLLEPILNDVIWINRDGFYEIWRICDVYDKPRNNTWKLHRIAERNGIPFMWPESEEA